MSDPILTSAEITITQLMKENAELRAQIHDIINFHNSGFTGRWPTHNSVGGLSQPLLSENSDDACLARRASTSS